jgi:hypothetical protein
VKALRCLRTSTILKTSATTGGRRPGRRYDNHPSVSLIR